MAVVPMRDDLAEVENKAKVIQLHVQKLKKDGTPKKISQNKKKGKSSEVDHLGVEDMKRIATYFQEKGDWLPYLLFVLSCNMARRIGDTMELTWEHFYNPVTGNFRSELMEINEQKTDKFANPKINQTCRNTIELYCEKTGCDPSLDEYQASICIQYTGNFKGRKFTQSGYYKSLKRAAAATGIESNVGAHSPRKTFGMLNRMIHPGDYDSMEILRGIFNHSDVKTTRRYIGMTKEKVNQYYDDIGDFFSDYIVGEKEYASITKSPIISIETNDLRDILKMAYEEGKNNANVSDPMVHIEIITNLLALIETIVK